jgi:hypothetical protein
MSVAVIMAAGACIAVTIGKDDGTETLCLTEAQVSQFLERDR